MDDSNRLIPEKIILHIYHEDMDEYFTGDEDHHYRAVASRLDTVPHLRYGDVHNIKFNLAENTNPSNLHGFESIVFKKSGTYLAQVSIKMANGTIDHYRSVTSIFTISDTKQDWIIDALDKLLGSAEEQKAVNIRTFGYTFIAIGIGIIFSGISLTLMYA